MVDTCQWSSQDVVIIAQVADDLYVPGMGDGYRPSSIYEFITWKQLFPYIRIKYTFVKLIVKRSLFVPNISETINFFYHSLLTLSWRLPREYHFF